MRRGAADGSGVILLGIVFGEFTHLSQDTQFIHVFQKSMKKTTVRLSIRDPPSKPMLNNVMQGQSNRGHLTFTNSVLNPHHDFQLQYGGHYVYLTKDSGPCSGQTKFDIFSSPTFIVDHLIGQPVHRCLYKNMKLGMIWRAVSQLSCSPIR